MKSLSKVKFIKIATSATGVKNSVEKNQQNEAEGKINPASGTGPGDSGFYGGLGKKSGLTEITPVRREGTPETSTSETQPEPEGNRFNFLNAGVGAAAGGLGGLGISSLLTKNKLIRALPGLAGAGIGGYLGNRYLTGQSTKV